MTRTLLAPLGTQHNILGKVGHLYAPKLIHPTPGDIRLRAYLNWEARGKPQGDPVQFWLEAERELKAKM